MISFKFDNIELTGLACCVPDNCETLDKYVDVFGREAVDNFMYKTGVQQRYIAKGGQTSSDLAYVAATKLLDEKQINRADVGVLVFVTQTPDYRLPATSYVLQDRLGLSEDCMCFDVNHGCSGYTYGLGILSSMLKSSDAKYGLLLTGDVISQYMAPEDKSVCMLMADGGSATLLQKKDNAAYINIGYESDGSSFKAVMIPSGASRNTNGDTKRTLWSCDGNVRSDYDLVMNGLEVFSYALLNVPRFVKKYLDAVDRTPNDYDAFVMHQANLYLMRQLAEKIGFQIEKTLVSVDRYGNTSVNSIPISIVDTFSSPPPVCKLASRLLLCSFGGGMSLGLVDIDMSNTVIIPMIYSNEIYDGGGLSHD